jgi:SAM-dependent methyltransferase
MEGDWDKRARENVRFYIDTCHYESEEAFEKSGEWDLENHILGGIDLDPRATVLEIGCGIGRLLKPLARRAAIVIGVDISREMVRQAQARLAALANIRIHKTEGNLSMVESSSVDFCFSFVVFQHFPAKELVFAYFQEAACVLRPGGIFRFQVNQRPEKFDRFHVADTWDGIGLDSSEVEEHLEEAGFKAVDAWGEMTHYAWYTAEEVRKVRPTKLEPLVSFRHTDLDPGAVRRVFERSGGNLSDTQLDMLLRRRLPWRLALDSLLEKWSSLPDEGFIRVVHLALLNREIDPATLGANLSLMQNGRLSRSIFLDCLVSSKEFRDTLVRSKG